MSVQFGFLNIQSATAACREERVEAAHASENGHPHEDAQPHARIIIIKYYD